jgi:type IV secretion system protein TrbJ
MKHLFIVLLTFGGLLLSPKAGDAQLIGGGVVICSNCADEATSLSARTQQALQYIQEAQTALKAVQMAAMMVTEGQQLLTHPSTNIVADINMMSSLLFQSKGLAGNLAQLDSQFNITFGNPYSANQVTTYASQYNAWATTALRSLNGLVSVSGYQGQMLQNENTWMSQIQAMNQSTMGRDQSIQLGNAIATQEVSQLQALRQLMIADMQSKAAFIAGAVNQQQSTQVAQQTGLSYSPASADQRSW